MKRSLVILRAVVVLACVIGIAAVVYYGKKAGLFGRRPVIPPPDYSKYEKIDPKLMIYRETSSIAVNMEKPAGVGTGPDGKIYVSGDKLVVFDPEGKQALETVLDAPAYCVTADEDGLIYMSVGDHIEIYDGSGKKKAAWESAGKDAVLGSVVVAGDYVFAADVKGRVLLRYDMLGSPNGRAEGFIVYGSRNIGMTLDEEGSLWVANPGRLELRRYSEEMKVVAAWRRMGRQPNGFSGCCNPDHIAAASDGTIVTSEKHIVRVKVVDRTGELIGVVAGPKELEGMEWAPPIAVTPDDKVLILDAGKKQVRVFRRKSG